MVVRRTILGTIRFRNWCDVTWHCLSLPFLKGYGLKNGCNVPILFPFLKKKKKKKKHVLKPVLISLWKTVESFRAKWLALLIRKQRKNASRSSTTIRTKRSTGSFVFKLYILMTFVWDAIRVIQNFEKLFVSITCFTNLHHHIMI